MTETLKNVFVGIIADELKCVNPCKCDNHHKKGDIGQEFK